MTNFEKSPVQILYEEFEAMTLIDKLNSFMRGFGWAYKRKGAYIRSYIREGIKAE